MTLNDLFENTLSGAEFSPCRTWRYNLWRCWAPEKRMAVFIGLNPSTADEKVDDPTIRRCIGFARQWGCGGIHMLNLFAFRATDPKVMKAATDPVGPDNDATIAAVCVNHRPVVACWGVHGEHLGRADAVLAMVDGLKCFGLTKDGYPKHPLYLPGSAGLIDLKSRAERGTLRGSGDTR